MLTPSEIRAALLNAGLAVFEMPGWRDRCRCHSGSHEKGAGPTGRPFGPIQGVMIHHTAGPMLSGQKAVDYTRNILIDGNGDTIGPLCLAGIDADGRILLVAAGRANHAGGISQAAKTALSNGTLSTTRWQDLRGSGVDGNSVTVGFEILAPGAPNAKQQDAAVRATAALLNALGHPGTHTIGHGEASNRRDYSDPGLNMGDFRAKVSRLTRPQPTKSASSQEEDMKIDDPVTWIRAGGKQETVNLGTFCWDMGMRLHEAEKRNEELSAKLDRIIKKIGA